MDDAFKKLLAETKFVVEATSNESQMFWEKFSTEAIHKHPEFNIYTWEQLNPGRSVELGTLAGMPVRLHIWWFRINGVLVMFYEPTSQVVDRRMVEAWLDKHCNPTCDKGTRPARCNSSNFQHALNYIRYPEQR